MHGTEDSTEIMWCTVDSVDDMFCTLHSTDDMCCAVNSTEDIGCTVDSTKTWPLQQTLLNIYAVHYTLLIMKICAAH